MVYVGGLDRIKRAKAVLLHDMVIISASRCGITYTSSKPLFLFGASALA
jgi:hypothetical protein